MQDMNLFETGNNNKQHQKYLGISDDGIYYTAIQEEQFLAAYEKNWSEIVADTYYESEQQDVGSKFRARLIYWGFFMNKEQRLDGRDFNIVARVAVCIELIHKASTMLDDFVKQNTVQYDKHIFHTITGGDKTDLYALNMLSHALNTLNRTFLEYSKPGNLLWEDTNVLTAALEDMTLAVLKGLDSSVQSDSDINRLAKFLHFEAYLLLTNGVAMGALLAGINNNDMMLIVEKIGREFGFLVQAIWDLEVFCSKQNNENKGSANTGFSRNNMCIVMLQPFLSRSEKKQIENSSPDVRNSLLFQYFNKYKIYDSLSHELGIIYSSLLSHIIELQKYDAAKNTEWTVEFTKYANSVFMKVRSLIPRNEESKLRLYDMQ